MSLKTKYRAAKLRIIAEAHSARGRDVLLYLLFVCVAFVFWLMLSLDSEVQRDYDVPVVVENIPDSVTFITTPPECINVGVTAKGSQLVQFSWGKIPQLKLNFEDYVVGPNTWAVNTAKLESRMRDYFGSSIIINAIRPDSLRKNFTTMPGEPIAIAIDADVTPNLQCIISGPIRSSVDSVLVYSVKAIPQGMHHAETEEIVRHNLKDTTYVDVALKHVAGLRFIPDRVRVMIPVEPLISKRQNVRIEAINLPESTSLITFPSEVTLSYLVPMSQFNAEYPLKATVDFEDVAEADTRLPVRISLLPQYMSNISISPDSVEYIIERH